MVIDKNAPKKKKYDLELPKNKEWPKTDGWLTKKDFPATVTFALEDPFSVKYEHWDQYNRKTVQCRSKHKNVDGEWKLDNSECELCRRKVKAGPRVYIALIHPDEPDKKKLLGVPVTAFKILMENFPDIVNWEGVVANVSMIKVQVNQRMVEVLGFTRPDGEVGGMPVDGEEGTAPTVDADMPEEELDIYVKKYGDMKDLGLGQNDIRGVISKAFKRDNIDAKYIDVVMGRIYS